MALLSVDDLIDERYEIRAPLEEAASYRAYRAFDREVEVEVALWHMRDELFGDRARREAFVGAVVEARALRHANLRRMFDAGDAAGVLYATCQLETDDGMLPRPGDGQALDDESLLHYATSVVDALAAAHEAGHVHGHLVPHDIVHVAGLIKVGGVGLYRDVDSTAARSAWMADERFIAPEVLSGQGATPASDVFSLAALLAELASGTRHDDVEVTVRALSATRPPLAQVLGECLSIAPERRLGAVTEVLDQVALALGYEPTTTADAVEPQIVDDDALYQALASAPFELGAGNAFDINAPDDNAPEEVPTRQLRAVGKARDFTEDADLETMVEGPWIAGTGAPPPAVPPQVHGPPAVPAAASAPEASDGSPIGPMPARAQPLRAVSRKPKSEPGRVKPQRVAVVDRAELKPVVRPISDARGGGKPVVLGNYAPPRQPGAGPAATPSSRRTVLALVIAGVALLAGGVVLALVLLGGGGGSATATDAAPVAAADTPRPVVTISRDAGVRAPCPRGMVEVARDEARFCIDRHEAPGQKGRMPSSGLSYETAAANCQKRGVRLCTPEEWESACRGERGASWPYGSSYRKGVCNVKLNREIAATGTFEECTSAAGLFDMSGNVAEWVQGKVVRGGSAADDSDGRCSRVVRRAEGSTAAFADVGYRCCAPPRER